MPGPGVIKARNSGLECEGPLEATVSGLVGLHLEGVLAGGFTISGIGWPLEGLSLQDPQGLKLSKHQMRLL